MGKKSKELKREMKLSAKLAEDTTRLMNFDRDLLRIGRGRVERDVLLGYHKESDIQYRESFDYGYEAYVEPHSKNYIVVEETDRTIRDPHDNALKNVAYSLIHPASEAPYNYLIHTLKSCKDVFIYLRRTVDHCNEYDSYTEYVIFYDLPGTSKLLTNELLIPSLSDMLGLDEQPLGSLPYLIVRDGKVCQVKFNSEGWQDEDDPIPFDTPGMIARVEQYFGIQKPQPAQAPNDIDTANPKQTRTTPPISIDDEDFTPDVSENKPETQGEDGQK